MIKKYNEFIKEEISKKGLLGAMGGAMLGLGVAGGGIAHYRDKQIEPIELTTSTRNEIPSEFEINEKILSIGHDFYITNSERENFGKIEQRVLSFGKKFVYFNSTGKVEAVAQAKVLSLKNIINVKDENDNLLGVIEQEVLESIGNILEGQNIYSIYDSNGDLLGKSKSDMITKNNIDIYDNNDKLIAKFKKPTVSFGARWSCEILNDHIDKRILIFIPAYISSNSSNSNKK